MSMGPAVVAAGSSFLGDRIDTMYDDLELRCPKLGGEVTFAYCKQENNGVPCARALVCWQFTFPVEEYLRKILTEEQWDQCFNQPQKDRMTALLEVIEKAKKRKGLGKGST